MQQQAPAYFKSRIEPRATPNAPKIKLKEWELEKQLGFGGTFGIWHMYSGRNKKSNAFGTVFVIEKKLVEKFVFGKADNLSKQFFSFINKDAAVPGKNAKEILIILEQLQEENNCLYYVTEPLVGTLSSLYKLFGHTCLNVIKRKADHEMLANANPRIYSANPFTNLLQYVQPDSIAYGYMTLLRSLSILQNDGYVFGNLTPANIAITPRGEWRLVGFSCCLPGGINFEFSSDSGALTRPCAHFMSPSMLQNKKASKVSDAFQLASCIYTIFGGRPCKYSSSSPCMQHMSTEELCEESAKMFGASLPTTTNVISPAAAVQNAATVPKWYSMTQTINATEQVCLSQMEAAMPSLWAASREECDCGQMYTEFLSKNSVARVANEIMELKKEMVFTASTPANSGDSNIMERTVQFLTKMLPICLEKRMLSVDLTMAAIWPRIVSMLSRRDIYRYTVPLLIQYSYMLEIPADQLYILLEPIVLACTLTDHRSKFPGTHSTQQAWTSGIEVYGRLFMYQTPYMDIPMDKSTKERTKFIPNFDKQINTDQESVITTVIFVLLEYASFFTNKKVGARSHYSYLNFLVSCLSSKNAMIQEKALAAIAACAPFIGDVTCWMMDHSRESLMAGTAAQQAPEKQDNTISTFTDRYTQPFVKSLTPKIIGLMGGSSTDAMMGSCLRCLAVIIAYLQDNDIAETVLPAIYGMIDPIIKSPKAVVYFAEFTQKVYTRCTAKSISMLFLPALLKGINHPGLETAQDLEQIRRTCSECFNLVDKDAYSRVQNFKPPTNPAAQTQAAAQQPQVQQNQMQQPMQQQYQQPMQQQQQQMMPEQQPHIPQAAPQAAGGYGEVTQGHVDNTGVEGTGYNAWGQNNDEYGGYNAQNTGYGGGYDSGAGGYSGYGNYSGYDSGTAGGYDSGATGGYGGYDNTSGGYGGYDNTSGGGYGGW